MTNLDKLAKQLEDAGFDGYWDFTWDKEEGEFWIGDKVAKWIDENTNFNSNSVLFYRMQ